MCTILRLMDICQGGSEERIRLHCRLPPSDRVQRTVRSPWKYTRQSPYIHCVKDKWKSNKINDWVKHYDLPLVSGRHSSNCGYHVLYSTDKCTAPAGTSKPGFAHIERPLFCNLTRGFYLLSELIFLLSSALECAHFSNIRTGPREIAVISCFHLQNLANSRAQTN